MAWPGRLLVSGTRFCLVSCLVFSREDLLCPESDDNIQILRGAKNELAKKIFKAKSFTSSVVFGGGPVSVSDGGKCVRGPRGNGTNQDVARETFEQKASYTTATLAASNPVPPFRSYHKILVYTPDAPNTKRCKACKA